MSTGKNIKAPVDSSSPVPTQNHSPDQPFYSLNDFYSTLLSKSFKTSTDAITFCRDLCSSHGFTVKQEQSTHKNIYVYCSREGLPDSHRNPKVNPQRNRQSQRCECRWRIVLYENPKTTWEFRKSQNADAFIHNHPLLRPEEIKKEWPREVSEKIFELARQRLPTNEIRQQVREQYPDISWDDRRFYNRLSEERQKMKQRDTASRTMRLVNLSAQICMVNAGSDDLFHYVESKLATLLEDTCRFANVNMNAISTPFPAPTTDPSSQNIASQQQDDRKANPVKSEPKRENDCVHDLSNKSSVVQVKVEEGSEPAEPKRSSPSSTISVKKSFEALPKGYIAVPIPERVFHVKMYSQNSAGDIRRAIFDMQRPASTASPNVIGANPHLQYVAQHREPRRRRSRALFAPEEDTDSMDLDTPARKLSRQVTSSMIDDELDDLSSQSSPSNSQSLLFAASNNPTHTHEINSSGNHIDHHHRQLMGSNNAPFSIPTASSASVGGPDMFYSGSNTNNGPEVNNNNSMDNSHFLQQAPFPPADNNVYPSPGNINASNNPASTHRPVQVMYDPNSFVQHPPPPTNEMSMIQAQHNLSDRPHSMTFGATIPNSMRAQSVSIPRTPLDRPSMVRPAGYPTNFVQLQNMIEENDGKQRYYPNYRDPLQQAGQPSSPIPPRTSAASSSQMMAHQHQPQHHQEYISQQQHHDNSQQPQIFPYPINTPSSSHQSQNIFPHSYMPTNEQLLQQQQHQQQQQQKGKQQYNFNFHQQQLDRQQHEQHLYRRASGPG